MAERKRGHTRVTQLSVLAVLMGAGVASLAGCSDSATTGGAEAEDGANLPGDGTALDDVELIEPGGFKDTSIPGPDVVEGETPSDFGEPCSENTDCESNWCVDSYKTKVCTTQCTENCPEGWVCAQITNTLPDVTFVCIPTIADLCKPCTDSKQCGGLIDPCLPIEAEGTSHCATACTTDAACPQGFSCEASDSGSFCRPVSQSCTCDATMEGLEQPCSSTNALGTCAGVRRCNGAAGWGKCDAPQATEETCNGTDDDCNGQVDDGVPEEACEVANDYGTCAGKRTCGGAAGWTCSAMTPLPEACNGVDDDCDGETDEKNSIGCVTYYADGDGDGVGNSTQSTCSCTPTDEHPVAIGGDCDDSDENIGALGLAETCTPESGIPQDEDCDGVTDEEGAVGCVDYFKDTDGDTAGATGDSKCLCHPDGSYQVLQGNDCDDSNADVAPGEPEVCNGVDDDCNGVIDDPGAQWCVVFYKDGDFDGVGAGDESQCTCGPTEPFTSPWNTDCDDANNTVFPGNAEKCNGFDDNCDGAIDESGAEGCTTWYADADGDSFGDGATGMCICTPPGGQWTLISGDCNDGDANIHPEAAEACGGPDEDCDGQTDDEDALGCLTYFADQDEDGAGVFADAACLCGPTSPYTATSAGDCDDQDAGVYPDALEACNGIDDNCDSLIDPENAFGCVPFYKDGDGDSVGLSGDSLCLCGPTGAYSATAGGDCNDDDAAIGPGGAESCNGIDDDCDSQIDEPGAVGCLPYYADEDHDTFGTSGVNTCMCAGTPEYPAAWAGDCDDADPLVFPGSLEPCTGPADCCEAGWACVYGICVPSVPPCQAHGDCIADSYCDNGGCVPYDVGPAKSQDDCVKAPKIGVFNPAIQCAWTGPPPGDAFPNHRQVLGTPMVVDFDFDDDPETLQPSVVFVSYDGTDGGFPAASSNGIVRVLDGSTCQQQHTIGIAEVVGAAPLALGDLDLVPDGRPEIVAFREGGGLIAFRYHSAAAGFLLHWVSTTSSGQTSTLASGVNRWNGPTLADVTGDAHPEVLMGTVLHDHTGKIIADNLGYKELTGSNTGNFSVVADVDLDGEPELVLSDGVYRYAGTATAGMWQLETYWTTPGNPSVFVAVGDFGNYPVSGLPAGIPEIAMVGNGEVRIVRLNGQTIFGPYPLPSYVANTPGYGGPPTIGDFDGDGQPELAAAGYGAYTVFDLSCVGTPVPLGCQQSGALWTRQSQDASSNRTGSSVFDFEADGVAEAVYADECFTRVYDGLTGEVLYSQSRTSCTWYENPIIADTDGDLRSEIVVGSNTNCGTSCPALDPIHRGLRCEESTDCPGASPSCVVGYCRCTANADCGQGSGYACTAPLPNTPGKGNVCRAAHQGATQGILVLQDFADGWVNSRPIWNQHVYAITEVTDQGRIRPRSEVVPNWTVPVLNNFRQNAQGEGDPTLSADVTIDPGVVYNCNSQGTLVIPVEVCNRGAAPVDKGLPIAFFAGNPDDPASDILCLEQTLAPLPPEGCEIVSCAFAPEGGSPVDIWVFGDFGGTQGKSTECVEENNYAVIPDVTCINLD